MMWEMETRWATMRASNEQFVHTEAFKSSFHDSWACMLSVHQLKLVLSGWMTTADTLMVVRSSISWPKRLKGGNNLMDFHHKFLASCETMFLTLSLPQNLAMRLLAGAQ